MKVVLKDLTKKFSGQGKNAPDVIAVNNFNVEIPDGKLIGLLGPSGCGKSTALNLISGLLSPTAGRIFFGEDDVTDLPPENRGVGLVFQNYALFPHMNVADNIGYGLKIRKVSKADIKKKVKEMLELVQLEGYEKRKPSELSGGQKQRVAIARALVNNPKVLLLDEPLGALDLQLRRAMQTELKHLQKKLGITFIYITHDQEEAINMSDRIAVMDGGRILQIGTPDEIYNHPKTSYVATFVGNANILHGIVESAENENVVIDLGCGKISAESGMDKDSAKLQPGEPVTLAVRSENIRLHDRDTKGLPATVLEKTFAGGQLRVTLQLQDHTVLTASRYGINTEVKEGQQIFCSFRPEDAVLVDREDAYE